MPRVSVVLPVHNGAKFVDDAVQSIVQQSFTDWELIAIDDCSADESASILESWALQDDRIRVYRNPHNFGLARTMNRAVELTTGEYIAVQEQDDMSTPERLSAEVILLDAHPEIGLVSGIAEWLDDELRPFTLFPGILVRRMQYPQDTRAMFQFLYVEQCKVVNAGCMFRKMAIDGLIGPFNEQAKMSIDWEFFLRLARGWRIWGIHEVVVRMRRGRSHESLTKNKLLQFSEARRLINEMRREYRDGPEPRVSHNMWRQAMAHELTLEARTWGRLRGIKLLLQAMLLCPESPKVWSTVNWFGQRVIGRIERGLSISRGLS